MKHHKGLGGSAYVYLLKSSDSASVRKTLSGLNGVDAVLTKSEAAKKYHLMPGRTTARQLPEPWLYLLSPGTPVRL
jgi:phosphonoacetate hydrolase